MIAQGVGWAPKPVGMFWRRQYSCAYAEIQNPDHPTHSLVTTLIGPILISVKCYEEEIYD
jgi:hypothetical protein